MIIVRKLLLKWLICQRKDSNSLSLWNYIWMTKILDHWSIAFWILTFLFIIQPGIIFNIFRAWTLWIAKDLRKQKCITKVKRKPRLQKMSITISSSLESNLRAELKLSWKIYLSILTIFWLAASKSRLILLKYRSLKKIIE